MLWWAVCRAYMSHERWQSASTTKPLQAQNRRDVPAVIIIRNDRPPKHSQPVALQLNRHVHTLTSVESWPQWHHCRCWSCPSADQRCSRPGSWWVRPALCWEKTLYCTGFSFPVITMHKQQGLNSNMKIYAFQHNLKTHFIITTIMRIYIISQLWSEPTALTNIQRKQKYIFFLSERMFKFHKFFIFSFSARTSRFRITDCSGIKLLIKTRQTTRALNYYLEKIIKSI